MKWKIQDKTKIIRPKLFCPQCLSCFSSKEDLHSREIRGLCNKCTKGSNSLEYHVDIVRILIKDAD
jgi:ribosomal protein S27AE